jgi:hypothetical protein
MSEPVRLKLDNGSEVVGRWASLEEWMMPLGKDHPARKELHTIRMNLASAMSQIDKLERLNAELHQRLVKKRSSYYANRLEDTPAEQATEQNNERRNDGNNAGEVLPGEKYITGGPPDLQAPTPPDPD